MANALYPTSFKQALLNAEHDLNTHVIKLTLIDSADVVGGYQATDTTYVEGANGIEDAAKVSVATIGTPTITTGTFDSANPTFSAVSGDVCEVLILWNDTHATDALIAWYDTGVTGFPVTPNSGDINVTVDGAGWWSL